MSVVSAGFWDWLTGDTTRINSGGDRLPAAVKSGDSSLTSGLRGAGASSSAKSRKSAECPRGWDVTSAKDEKIGNCCVKGKNGERSPGLFGRG